MKSLNSRERDIMGKKDMFQNKKIKIFAIIIAFSCVACMMPNTLSAKAASSRYPNIYYFTTNAANHSINLKWKKGYNPSSYYIWRKVSGGKYYKIKTLSKKYHSYTDTKVKAGYRYYYKVEVNRKGTNYRSKAYGITLTNISAPKLKTLETYTMTNGKLANKLSFTAGTDKTYMIYRKVSNGSYKCIKTINGKAKKLNSFIDYSINKNNTYTYTVKAKRTGKYYTQYGKYDASGIVSIKDVPRISNVKVTDLNNDASTDNIVYTDETQEISGPSYTFDQVKYEIYFKGIPNMTAYSLSQFCKPNPSCSGYWNGIDKVSGKNTYFDYIVNTVNGGQTQFKVQGIKTVSGKTSYSNTVPYEADLY
ncbi:MAG: hypothetical protein LBM02_08730 [Lachnospiraceae bacterium]|jgi:hypothetical protein|nr:hypothetical protein [Lachnospiraceae bacterium]